MNYLRAEEESRASMVCFRAMSVCPVSGVALDSGASKKHRPVFLNCGNEEIPGFENLEVNLFFF